MKALAAAAVALSCSLPALAQEPRTGVSTPPPMTDATPAAATDTSLPEGYRPTPTPALGRQKLVADPPAVSTAAATETYAPYNPTGSARASQPKPDVDAGIVTDVPHAANEAPIGTTFKVRMASTISTATTAPGTPFTAALIEPIQQNGQILIPSGSTLDGRITQIHGGHRVHGAASIHLEPHSITLPDGTRYNIRAQVVDTDQSFATRIDDEGTILRRDHIKATLGVLSATTGTAAVAGAVVGGGVGAVVGAGIGAGVGTAWWLKQDRQTVLPESTAVTFSLNEPIIAGPATR